MSRRQVEVCAARLQPADPAKFTAMLAEAALLFRLSVRLRLAAWQLYRDRTGTEKRPATKGGKA